MSTDLGSMGSYNMAVQTAQIAAIKQSLEMQQAVVDMLIENTTGERSVAASPNLGHNIDITA